MSFMKRAYDKVVLHVWTFGVVFLVALNAFLTRRRMSHDMGVMGAGKIKIVDDPQFPANDFFEPGKEFSCRVRHAGAAYFDEAKICFRGASIKFADTRLDSPLDIIMNSGPTNPTYTLRTFAQFIPGKVKGGGHAWDPFFAKHPKSFVACERTHRRNPESYTKVYYYSQVPVGFAARDGVERLVKFRMIPASREPESGLPSPGDLAGLPSQARLVGETRARDYLTKEFKERVQRNEAAYVLQLQLHDVKPDDSDEIYNSLEEWDDRTHPWIDVATIELDRVLSLEESRMTIFTLGNTPPSLYLIPAKSIDDYNSVNHLRLASMTARKARVLGYKLLGTPDELPPLEDLKPVVEPTPEQRRAMPAPQETAAE